MTTNRQTALAREIRITGYRPELAVQLISWIARYFLAQWGDDAKIRARVTEEVQQFLTELDNPRNGVICAWDEENFVGAVAIDAVNVEADSARIRWFIVDDQYRGMGYGRFLFEKALEYCQTAGFDKIILQTFKGVDPAIPLYFQTGFILVKEKDVSTDSTKMVELYFEKLL